MLQCKKERVNYYQLKLASHSEQNERQITNMDIADRQSPCDGAVDAVMPGEVASSLKITAVRKRTQTSEYINLPTRKSARLAGKNT